MTEEKSDKSKVDPFSQMMAFYDTWAKTWSEAMSETVSSKKVAEAMGQQMETSLEAMSLVRQQVRAITEQYLQEMGLPARDQVVTLAERLTAIEMRVDDVDAKLDEILDQLKAMQET